MATLIILDYFNVLENSNNREFKSFLKNSTYCFGNCENSIKNFCKKYSKTMNKCIQFVISLLAKNNISSVEIISYNGTKLGEEYQGTKGLYFLVENIIEKKDIKRTNNIKESLELQNTEYKNTKDNRDLNVHSKLYKRKRKYF